MITSASRRASLPLPRATPHHDLADWSIEQADDDADGINQQSVHPGELRAVPLVRADFPASRFPARKSKFPGGKSARTRVLSDFEKLGIDFEKIASKPRCLPG